MIERTFRCPYLFFKFFIYSPKSAIALKEAPASVGSNIALLQDILFLLTLK